MTSIYPGPSDTTSTTSIYPSLLSTLRAHPTPLLPRPTLKPLDPSLTPKISDLHIHPTLEAALHILNHDLPSAHFLVRHMGGPPAFEGMFLHGILHRIEGDYANAAAWYSDVALHLEGGEGKEEGLGVWGAAWGKEDDREGREKIEGKTGAAGSVRGKLEGKGMTDASKALARAETFLSAVEELYKEGKGDKGALEKEGKREIDAVISWCERKFGTEKWVDGMKAWVRENEEVRKIGQSMVSGDKGARSF